MSQPRVLLTFPVIFALLVLVACGGGGGGGTGSNPIPLTSGDRQFAGVDQRGSNLGRLSSAGRRDDVSIRYGTLNDGAGRAAVAGYLSQAQGSQAKRFTTAPRLRVIGPSTARERRLVEEAVQAINLALPAEFRIRIDAPQSGYSLRDSVSAGGRGFVFDAVPGDTVYVEFLDCVDYYDCGQSGGTTWPWLPDYAYTQLVRSTPAYRDDRQARILFAHEILHALGIRGHVTGVDSIMLATNSIFGPGPASLLKPVDREAMRALYGRLRFGDDLTSFGPWSGTGLHLAGNGPHANFGVVQRNGYTEAWAHGLRPSTHLSRNTSLSGTATWEGAILGLTPRAEAVAGDAEISVTMTSLTGSAAFTNLESWAARQAPGAEGTGVTWGDGDLAYRISVRGNTFRETGGDAGRVTGIFTGRSHEGAAGTLERSDLTAAFGATR